ncbi:uncharacterized protein LOC143850383 [Tasmannia lanceolata]|uniref:uncharacterized protein LOC143850383 n=1 Tax=Tasmannia lanceolata TaxID=3420 RepID=UPI0040635D30
MVSDRGIEVDPQKIKAIEEMEPPKTEKQIRGEPLLLYLSITDTTMGCMLAQKNPESKQERPIYYISKKMLEYDIKYSILEKTCLALVWATQRLKHYLLSNKVEFPDEDIMDIEEETLSNKWLMYFEGAVNNHGQGVGAVLVSPRKEYIPISIMLQFECTNNMAEYEAYISATMEVQPLAVRLQWAPAHVNTIEIPARYPYGKPWYTNIKNLISGKGHPPKASSKERKTLQRLATNFIICGEELYGVPHELISNNGSHFKREVVHLCEEFKIKHHKSSPYGPQTNGVVEATNKYIKDIISKMTELYKNWSNKLPYALWDYRTSIRSSKVELRIPSWRVMLEADLLESEWAKSRHDELQMIDEKRLRVLYDIQGYQRRIERAFNKKV